MLNKSIKTVLVAGIVAVGTSLGAVGTANAGGNFGVYISDGHGGGIYFGNGGGRRYQGGGSGPRRHCGPRRALNKAWNMGVNRPEITRLGGKRIVVKGFSRGHRAKVVFKRNSRHCRVISRRGV